jgi:serine/threonine protein kinase
MCFVKSFGWYDTDESVFITMEYFPLGDLQNYLSSPLPETDVQQITSQILEGLLFMHDNAFAHRDLKPTVSLPFHLSHQYLAYIKPLIILTIHRTF